MESSVLIKSLVKGSHNYAAGVSDQRTRLERRKARTRQALLSAAREILAAGGSTDVSIQEITDRADVGFGSFYNHFTSKTELFEAAVAGVLEEHGAWLQEVTAGIDDPVAVFATRFRLTARLASSAPAVAAVFARSGMEYLISDRGLAPMALADLEACMDAGRLPAGNPQLALVATGGCLLAYLQLRLTGPELLTDDDADTLTERLLVMLGLPADEASSIAHAPLPGD